MMRIFFASSYLSLAAGILLAILAALMIHGGDARANMTIFATALLLWLHVGLATFWLGLLWYQNLVQIPALPVFPKPGAVISPPLSRHLAEWFRYLALASVISGLLLAWMKGYILEALMVRPPAVTIGIGMWIALVMACNVWTIVWPLQKRLSGLVQADADTKARAAATCLFATRLNFILSFPMLYCMVGQGAIG